MKAIFKEHGHRRLILIFILIMFSVLGASVKYNTGNINTISNQVIETKAKQSSLETFVSSQLSVLKTETTKKIEILEKKLDEQDKLISELERLMNR